MKRFIKRSKPMTIKMRTMVLGLVYVLAGFAAVLVLTPQSAHTVSLQEVTRSHTEDLQRRVADLTKRLEALESSVKVSPVAITMQTSGPMSLKGSVISLNGGRPVARVGDTVSVTVVCPPGGGQCAGTGTITSGSNSVLAN